MSKIPDFQTLDELIAFWDEYDSGDYWDELEEVNSDEALPDYSRREEEEQP